MTNRKPVGRAGRLAARLRNEEPSITVAVALGLALAVVVLAVLVYGPHAITAVGESSPAIIEERRTIVAVLVAVGGGVGLYYRRKGHQLSRDEDRSTRYTQAIEQLGHEKAAVRLGGIYALGRLAGQSPSDVEMISNVLCAYVREPHLPDEALPEGVGSDHAEGGSGHPTYAQVEKNRRSDILAAMQLIGSPPLSEVGTRRNLRGADLRGYQLGGLDLHATDFHDANLVGAYLLGSDLRDCWFADTDLRGSSLREADLRGSRWIDVDCSPWGYVRPPSGGVDTPKRPGAFVRQMASLRRADLRNARMGKVDLTEARLTRAKFDGAMLVDVEVSRALVDDVSEWATGADRVEVHGSPVLDDELEDELRDADASSGRP